MDDYPLDSLVTSLGGKMREVGGLQIPMDYGDPKAEYEAGLHGAAVYDARDRGLVEVTGNDRAAWLHNLLTNTVKTLKLGQGNYSFACNAKGRIQFDCNVLVRQEAIWLDVDRRLIPKVLAHLERYHIAEDVQVTDRSNRFCRIILLGPRASEIISTLGATDATELPSLGSTQVMLEEKSCFLVRHDSAGVLGFELYVEAADAEAYWRRLTEVGQPYLRPIGRTAVEVLRIEAGIPVYGQDINEEVLPAETGQSERAISFVKGCYLGQEIVERMRSRGALARIWVGLKCSPGADMNPGMTLYADDAPAGHITSACDSYATGSKVALAYVKTTYAVPGTRLRGNTALAAGIEVVSLPRC